MNKDETVEAPERVDRATPQQDDEWFVGPRPLDVLLRHVPGFEVNREGSAEWMAIARTQDIGEEICRAVNAYDSQAARIRQLEEACKKALTCASLNGDVRQLIIAALKETK